jgi:hypothetical protein
MPNFCKYNIIFYYLLILLFFRYLNSMPFQPCILNGLAGSQIIYYRPESANKQTYYKPSQENLFISVFHNLYFTSWHMSWKSSKKFQHGLFSGRENESSISSHHPEPSAFSGGWLFHYYQFRKLIIQNKNKSPE